MQQAYIVKWKQMLAGAIDKCLPEHINTSYRRTLESQHSDGKETVHGAYEYVFKESGEPHGIALFYMYYNFAQIHQTLKTEKLAMAAGVTDRLWSVEELLTNVISD
jgi:hypothetical protein